MPDDSYRVELITGVPVVTAPAEIDVATADQRTMADTRNCEQCGALFAPRLARYRAYQAHLAGHTIGHTFGRAAEFINLAAANVLLTRGTEAHVGR
jgi:hypothetical protein